jgi:hypothetical protein
MPCKEGGEDEEKSQVSEVGRYEIKYFAKNIRKGQPPAAHHQQQL